MSLCLLPPKLEPVVAAKTVPVVGRLPRSGAAAGYCAALAPQPAPVKKAEADPAMAKAARVDKPAPANVPLLIPRTLAFEQALAQRPGAPSHEVSVTIGGVAGGAVRFRWDAEWKSRM